MKKTSSPKSDRKIDVAEAVKRVDRAETQQSGTPPEPYRQDPESGDAFGKAGRAAVDEALRRIDKAVNRGAPPLKGSRKEESGKMRGTC